MISRRSASPSPPATVPLKRTTTQSALSCFSSYGRKMLYLCPWLKKYLRWIFEGQIARKGKGFKCNPKHNDPLINPLTSVD